VLGYIARRLVGALVTLVLVISIVFVVTQILPGDPAVMILGDRASAESLEKLREELGLNEPLWVQYLSFFRNVFRGSLGESLVTHRPVLAAILHRLPYSLILSIAGAVIGVLFGIPGALVAAFRKNSGLDFLIRVVSLTLVSCPTFLIGVLLMIPFSIKLGWFPLKGGGSLDDIVSMFRHLFLPALSVGVLVATFVLRAGYPALLEVLSQDYVRTAYSKGLKFSRVCWVHVLRNALIPIVTLTGLFSSTLVAGSVMVEIVFVRPGIGTYLVSSLEARDLPALQGSLLIIGIFVILMNLLVDITYGILDPRIRYD